MARILVIDGDSSIRALLKAALTDAGHRVAATDGDDGAIDKLGRKRFDFVLANAHAAEAPGEKALDAIAAHPGPPKIIAMTDEARSETPVIPAHAFVAKSIDADVLLTAVTAAMQS